LKKRWFWVFTFTAVLVILVGYGAGTGLKGTATGTKTDEAAHVEEGKEMRENYQTSKGETGFIYLPSSFKKGGERTYPLVIMMNGTAQDPIHDARGTGWVALAKKEELLLLVPEYDDYATYSNVDTLISVLDDIEDTYPVDKTRVYATGFSNGGAMSVALASVYPERFAAISAYGWMVDMQTDASLAEQYDMPFQVLQGTEEYTGTDNKGNPVIMQDEQEAIRSLFLFDEMMTEETKPDYRTTPYWGYEPSSIEKTEKSGTPVTISSYRKEGYKNPFAQLVLIDGETHRVHDYDAELAWDFMRKFRRREDGSLSEK
jgi:poly(3-hydroxybutyrate) depolymerase